MSELHDFSRIVGPEYVATVEGRVEVSPATSEEVSTVLRFCTENNLRVTPTGAGTKRKWGNPIEADVLLSIRRLSGIREHVWQDMTATVGAGTAWTDLQGEFAEHGQTVALDALFPAQSTVGGTLAVNDSGALRVRYGSLRDLVLGMTIVLADGTIARSGGKVVKNVAGYDLPKLLVGSFGTLGVITEVSFRLHPLERSVQSWSVSGVDVDALGTLMLQLLHAGTNLQALQLRLDATGTALDVRFASAPAALQADAERLRSVCAGADVERCEERVWQWREQMFADPGAAVLKITALPTQLGAIVSGFAECRLEARCAAEAAGIVTVQLRGEARKTEALVDELRSRLRAQGGMVVVLQWPFEEVDIERWGGSPPAIDVMRAVKQQFDPQRTLNPGKFVGGI